ncbi:MAG: DUF2142 domain-containing protein [Bifidobacterium sp.]|nr:DUF2142 domain-containing protein [Bifidobacterium sp.]
MNAPSTSQKESFQNRGSTILSFLGRLCRPEFVFLIISLVVGSCFALFVPAGSNADESSHVARVETIAHGEFNAPKITKVKGYTSPLDKRGKDATLYGGMVDSLYDVAQHNLIVLQKGKERNSYGPYSFPTWKSKQTQSDAQINHNWRLEAFSGTAVNSPFVYLPYILAYWVSQIFTSNAYAIIIMMRLFGLLTVSLIVFFCIKVIPIGKWVLASVGLLPLAIANDASISADVLTFAMCIALITEVLICSSKEGQLGKKNWVMLYICSISMGVIKLSYLPLLLLLLWIPIFNRSMRSRRSILLLSGCLVAACIVFLLWYVQISEINTGALYDRGISPTFQKKFMFAHPLTYLFALVKLFFEGNFFGVGEYGMIEAFGPTGVSGSATVIVLCLAIFLRDSRESGHLKFIHHGIYFSLVSLAAFLCTFLLIGTALYLQFCPVGSTFIEGVQSRYYLPITLLLLLPIIIADGCLKYPVNKVCGDLNTETNEISLIEDHRLYRVTMIMVLCQVLSAVFALLALFKVLFAY